MSNEDGVFDKDVKHRLAALAEERKKKVEVLRVELERYFAIPQNTQLSESLAQFLTSELWR